MARTSDYVPGFEGVNSRYRTQIGLQLPQEYIDLIEKQLQSAGREASIQTIIKMCLVAMFPVPGYEQETEMYLNRFFNGSKQVNSSQEEGQSEFEEPHPSINRSRVLNFNKHSTPGISEVKDPKKEEDHEVPEMEIGSTDWKVVASSKKEGVNLVIRSLDNMGEVDLNTWQHREFFKTNIFITEQCKAVAALKHEELQMDRDDLQDAMETALFKLFPEAVKA